MLTRSQVTKTPRRHEEETFQRAVMKFLAVALDPNSTFFFHCPNGGYRRYNEAKRLKAMGVRAGIPDIGIVWDGKIAWLELKAGKGGASDIQLYRHEQLRRARSPVSLCKTIDDVIAALTAAGVPLKARLAA